MKCGECPLWFDQHELPWGDRVGICPRRQGRYTDEGYECDRPLHVLYDLREAVDKAIAMREKEVEADGR